MQLVVPAELAAEHIRRHLEQLACGSTAQPLAGKKEGSGTMHCRTGKIGKKSYPPMSNIARSPSDLFVAFDIAKHEKLRLQDRYLFNPLAYCQKSPLVTFPMPKSVLLDQSTLLSRTSTHEAAVAKASAFLAGTACSCLILNYG